jgi:hypothetical protein
MAVLFTSRFRIVRTASGKFRVGYGPLFDTCERIITIESPEFICPPVEELTESELDAWEWQGVTNRNWVIVYDRIDEGAPSVEARMSNGERVAVSLS